MRLVKLTMTRGDRVLGWTIETCAPELRRWIEALGGTASRITAYQFGWSDDYTANPRHGGKHIRAALALLCARAAGSDPRRALPAAAAVELVHALSLLYDDVLDSDDIRRHRPTAWRVFGRGPVTGAADGLIVLAFEAFSGSDRPPEIARAASVSLFETLVQLAIGESLDLLFEERRHVEIAECAEMISGKTASLFSCACRLGALFGHADDTDIRRFASFGHDLGMLYQLEDDLLGIWGDSNLTGKPVFMDLNRRKMSMPVVAALASGTPAAKELADRYALPPGEDLREEGEKLAALIEEAGGRQWTNRVAGAYLDAAMRWLKELRVRADVEREAIDDLEAICDLMVNRSR
ncbi:polyprenyl synthetase family protein [Streptomyces fagopyri]|uniref:polyprenyl synthetase family protein n=1 Tax=Streptomyces fagopyri TaxID=2662397 RepID=UPI00369A52E8